MVEEVCGSLDASFILWARFLRDLAGGRFCEAGGEAVGDDGGREEAEGALFGVLGLEGSKDSSSRV